MTLQITERSISVSTANERGVSGLLRDAENGSDVIVERHGQPVAAIIGVWRLAELIELEANLRSAALVLSRAATDTGVRTDLDTVITTFGFDRAELEKELEADLATDA